MIRLRQGPCCPRPPMGQFQLPTSEDLESGAQKTLGFLASPWGKVALAGLITGMAAKFMPGKFLAGGITGALAAVRFGLAPGIKAGGPLIPPAPPAAPPARTP